MTDYSPASRSAAQAKVPLDAGASSSQEIAPLAPTSAAGLEQPEIQDLKSLQSSEGWIDMSPRQRIELNPATRFKNGNDMARHRPAHKSTYCADTYEMAQRLVDELEARNRELEEEKERYRKQKHTIIDLGFTHVGPIEEFKLQIPRLCLNINVLDVHYLLNTVMNLCCRLNHWLGIELQKYKDANNTIRTLMERMERDFEWYKQRYEADRMKRNEFMSWINELEESNVKLKNEMSGVVAENFELQEELKKSREALKNSQRDTKKHKLKLEHENSVLQSKNDQLKSENEKLKAFTAKKVEHALAAKTAITTQSEPNTRFRTPSWSGMEGQIALAEASKSFARTVTKTAGGSNQRFSYVNKDILSAEKLKTFQESFERTEDNWARDSGIAAFSSMRRASLADFPSSESLREMSIEAKDWTPCIAPTERNAAPAKTQGREALSSSSKGRQKFGTKGNDVQPLGESDLVIEGAIEKQSSLVQSPKPKRKRHNSKSNNKKQNSPPATSSSSTALATQQSEPGLEPEAEDEVKQPVLARTQSFDSPMKHRPSFFGQLTLEVAGIGSNTQTA